VISELSRALREEERQAWQRIVRVIGHELNSSLAPIKSMAGTVRKLVGREPLPTDWRDDARAGLAIIHDRAESLERFMGAYARLARLPPPTRRGAELAALVRRVASLHETRIAVEPGPSVHISIDPDQIEQVFINLMRNAVEASGEQGGVRVRWRSGDERRRRRRGRGRRARYRARTTSGYTVLHDEAARHRHRPRAVARNSREPRRQHLAREPRRRERVRRERAAAARVRPPTVLCQSEADRRMAGE
jgi:signal transduction histidine kinase